MIETNNQSIIPYSNVWTYFEIAQESFCSMNLLMQNRRKPRADREAGRIIIYDPDKKSFKEAMVTIIFSGVYLEALLHLLIVKKHGIKKFNAYDHKKYYEKLQLLGCKDESISDKCEHYITVRNEIVHEKAHKPENAKTIRVAQKEATRAFNLVESINAHFGINMG